MEGRTYLLLLDANRHGDIEHVVLYSQSKGHLDRLVASHECDPFAPVSDLVVWLRRTLAVAHSLPTTH